ncbi:MAG TPA: D-alanyl-D-alanine carboxypeptidase/D-alanyl-D-alanine-endopeptidase [Bryobacteraceae bacterium]
MASFLLACGAGLGTAASAALPQRIAALIQASPDLERAHIGYQFIDLKTGRVLAEHDASRMFMPASNRKLFVTAMALIRLGPGYKYKTELTTRGPWKPGQTVLPNLQLVGGGDPNLSGRVLPYSVDAPDGDPFAALEQLADKLVKLNIHAIDGDVTGVATRYPGDRFPLDWTRGDTEYGYGAPISALTLDDNVVTASVTPTEPGDLAAIALCPNVHHFVVVNQVVTDASKQTHIHIRRPLGSNELILWGTIGKSAPVWEQGFAVDNPALFAAQALISVLRDRGIVVRGSACSQYTYANEAPQPDPPAIVLAEHESAPLWEDLQVTNKVSENLHAEMLLREVGFIQCGRGTLKAGLDAENTFLQQIGLDGSPPQVDFFDGCGLAREDLATPAAIVALLRYMWESPYREMWLQTLPIGGVDGTLQHRFQGIPNPQRVHAKTGSLNHVDALSGYMEVKPHRWIVFSMLVNGTPGDNDEARGVLDSICGLFLRR